MIIRHAAEKMAVEIKRIVPDHPASTEVLRYALTMILNPVLAISLALIISLFTKQTLEVLTAIAGFAVLRHVSGGLHLKSNEACVLVSATGGTLLSLVSLGTEYVFILNALSCALVLLLAPTELERTTWIQKQSHAKLKFLSFVLVISNFVIMSPVLASAFFVQALTLIQIRRSERGE